MGKVALNVSDDLLKLFFGNHVRALPFEQMAHAVLGEVALLALGGIGLPIFHLDVHLLPDAVDHLDFFCCVRKCATGAVIEVFFACQLALFKF